MSDSDSRSIEECKRKSLKILPVREPLLLQKAERHTFAELQGLHEVAAPVNTREVTAQGDVRSELIKFAADREPIRIRSGIRLRTLAIR